jgi:hypothetical protein
MPPIFDFAFACGDVFSYYADNFIKPAFAYFPEKYQQAVGNI